MSTQSGLSSERLFAWATAPRFGGSGPSTTTTENKDPWIGQQPYLRDVFSQAQGLYNQAGPEYYQDSTVAPLNPMQDQALNSIFNMGMGGGSTALQGANASLTDTLGGDYLMAGNPYFSAMSDRIAGEVMPRIQGTFEAAGRGNSGLASRAGAMGLADSIGALAYGNYGDERKNMMGAAGMAPGIDTSLYSGLNAAQGAGGVFQQMDQNVLNDLVNRWNYEQNLPWNKLGNYSQMVQGNNYGGQSTSTSRQSSGSNPLGMILGGLSAIGSIAGSDRRLKEDIRRIGTADNGLAIYAYRYKGEPGTHLGFMADEVIDVRPEAVALMDNGYFGVDYAKAVL